MMIPMVVAVALAFGTVPLPELGPEVVDAVGMPTGPPLAGPALEDRLAALSSEIRCPVCQGQAIVDSPAESARNMKDQVRAMLSAGYSDEQVLVWLEGRYGQFIRLSPRAEGLNLLVWVLPLVLLLLGVGVVAWVVARSRKALGSPSGLLPEAAAAAAVAAPSSGVAPPSAAPSELDPWIERVRRETGGRDE